MSKTGPENDKLIGQTVGPYVIREQIGRGGMGVVYKAYEKNLDRIVAIKFLPAQMSGDPKFSERFLAEARAVAKLEHPNIVPVYSAGNHDGMLYIAMQYVKGKTFADMMDAQGIIPTRMALEITRGAMQALGFAHAQGLVHRDIKPDNVMIDEAGNVKVMDFGLAKRNDLAGSLTQSGLYLGTPEYSSPEQCETLALDGRSDIYSLGVVLYEALSGGLPHTAETPLALFNKVTREEPSPIRMLNAAVPKTVEALLQKMMAKKRQERYARADEVVRDIDKIFVSERFSETPAAVPAPAIQRHRHVSSSNAETLMVNYDKEGRPSLRRGSRWAAAAAVALLAIGGTAIALHHRFKGGASATSENGNSIQPVAAQGEISAELAPYVSVKRVGVLPFKNTMGDRSIDWMTVGLQDMVATSLTGSELIEIISPAKLKKEYERLLAGFGDDIERQDNLLQSLASQLKLDFIVTGKFYQDDKDLRIDIAMQDFRDYQYTRAFRTAKEAMLGLVDELTADVRREISGYIRDEAEATAARAKRARSGDHAGAPAGKGEASPGWHATFRAGKDVKTGPIMVFPSDTEVERQIFNDDYVICDSRQQTGKGRRAQSAQHDANRTYDLSKLLENASVELAISSADGQSRVIIAGKKDEVQAVAEPALSNELSNETNNAPAAPVPQGAPPVETLDAVVAPVELPAPATPDASIEMAVDLAEDAEEAELDDADLGRRLAESFEEQAVARNEQLLRCQDAIVKGIEAAGQDQLQESIAWFEKALAIFPQNPTAEYNLACIHSRLGHIEQSREYFERSVQKGFVNVAFAEKDPDLKNLRASECYADLVQCMQDRKSMARESMLNQSLAHLDGALECIKVFEGEEKSIALLTQQMYNVLAALESLYREPGSQEETLADFMRRVQDMTQAERDTLAAEAFYTAQQMVEEKGLECLEADDMARALMQLYRAFLCSPNFAKIPPLLRQLEERRASLLESCVQMQQEMCEDAAPSPGK